MWPHFAESTKLIFAAYILLQAGILKTGLKLAVDAAFQRLERCRAGEVSKVIPNNKPMFPCPVCTGPREVLMTKKDKPYITCDPCGVQVFVRGPAGISEFNRLLQTTSGESLLERLTEMERQYRLTCPKCGHKFWITPKLTKTSVFDGTVKGFRCPERGCGGIAPWGEDKQ